MPKNAMKMLMIPVELMQEMHYEGFSYFVQSVYLNVTIYEDTQISGLMEYDIYEIAKRMRIFKKDIDTLKEAIQELKEAGWLWIEGDWLFAPKMRLGFDGLREYKQKAHIKRMLESVSAEKLSNIAIDKWKYTYADIIDLVKSDEEFEKYEQKIATNPHEKEEIRTENTISAREAQLPHEKEEIRTENTISAREAQLPHETTEIRVENQESDNFCLQEHSFSSFSSFSLGDTSVVRELGERGVGKTENEKTDLPDDVSSVLAKCIARGVPQSFAEACIAQAESVSWTDATGRAITKRVAYVESAWARQSMGSRKIERSAPAKGQKRNGHEITSVAGDPIKGLAIVGGA